MENNNIKDILCQFDIVNDVEPYGNGHINDTFIAGTDGSYILQRINTSIFKDVDGLMDNISSVTEHLRGRIAEKGGNPDRETLTVIKTSDGKNYYRCENGECYRVYKLIENSKSYDMVENPMQFYHAAKAFGRFQNMLNDFPAEKLNETIVDFHDTRKRIGHLEQAIAEDKCGRLNEVKAEVEFALARKDEMGVVMEGMENGTIPVRVTHNDTKLNNVMLDIDTGEGVCVIDLDTVMPGSLLFDYGDALRFGASSGSEDETDLSKIYFDMNLFEHFTKGYLEETKDILTEREYKLLPFSAKLLTYECGIRFLTDYLNGDTYFKIHREKHNLDRCRTQFKLVYDMEQKMDEMKKVIDKY